MICNLSVETWNSKSFILAWTDLADLSEYAFAHPSSVWNTNCATHVFLNTMLYKLTHSSEFHTADIESAALRCHLAAAKWNIDSEE